MFVVACGAADGLLAQVRGDVPLIREIAYGDARLIRGELEIVRLQVPQSAVGWLTTAAQARLEVLSGV